MIFKLVRFIAIRSPFVLVGFSALLVGGFRFHVDGVHGVGVGEEPCLHLWLKVMLVVIVFRHGEGVLLVGEESLGGLAYSVPSIVVS